MFSACSEQGGAKTIADNSGAASALVSTPRPSVSLPPSENPSVEPKPTSSNEKGDDGPASAATKSVVALAFVGDIALNYSIAKNLEALSSDAPPKDIEPGFPFAAVRERLRAADIAIGNLECVLSPKGKVDTWHKPFRGPKVGIDAIVNSGIDVVSVANNHSFDYGEEGFFDMLKSLDEKKLGVIGRGYRQKSPHEPEKVLVREVRGIKVGLLGFYLERDEDIRRDVIAAALESDIVVAYFHWGREKQSEPSPEQRQQAQTAIVAGADLVIGTHAHVLQPTEMFQGKLIVYGLGNFVFMGMNNEERFRKGGIFNVSMTKQAQIVSFELISTRVDDRGAPVIVVPESSYLPGKEAKTK